MAKQEIHPTPTCGKISEPAQMKKIRTFNYEDGSQTEDIDCSVLPGKAQAKTFLPLLHTFLKAALFRFNPYAVYHFFNQSKKLPQEGVEFMALNMWICVWCVPPNWICVRGKLWGDWKQEERSCLRTEENWEENWQEITINYIPAVLIVPGACPANSSSLIRIFALLQQRPRDPCRGVEWTVDTSYQICWQPGKCLPKKFLRKAFLHINWTFVQLPSCFWDQWSWSLSSSQMSITCIMVTGGHLQKTYWHQEEEEHAQRFSITPIPPRTF